jgi:hypothetical protein
MENLKNSRAVLLGAALVFCAALAAQAPAVSDSLLWDDALYVAANPFVRDCKNLLKPLAPANFFKVLPVPMAARPAVNASLIADACAGAGPRGLKLTNLLLHAFNGVLLFLLLLALTGEFVPALGAAALFAAHPAAAELVNIAVFRSHLLGFFFFTCALLASLSYARKPSKAAALAAPACALLGMLSVETAIVIPAAAAAVVYADSGKEALRRCARLLAALLLTAAFYGWFRAPRSGYDIEGVSSRGVASASALYPRSMFPSTTASADRGMPLTPWNAVYTAPREKLFTMSGIVAGYIKDMALPVSLRTDYNPRVVTASWTGFLLLLFTLSFPAAGAWLLYRRNLAGLGLALAVLALAPAWNILPIYNIRADRYLYLPLGGAALFLAALLARLPRRAAGAAALAAVLFFGALSVRRAPAFKDDLAFFSEAVRRGPDVPRARANLAAALLRSGDCAGASKEADAASRLAPENALLRLRLAYTLAACRNGAGALPEALRALQALPGSADALYLAGLLELKTDRAAGRALLAKALAADPAHEEARLTLALLDKKKAGRLSPRENTALAELAAFYRKAGLFF